MENFNVTILENGEIMHVSKKQANSLVKKDLIYPCEDCGKHIYHLNLEVSYKDIDKSIQDFKDKHLKI